MDRNIEGGGLPQLEKEDYTIAWVCALPETEMLASKLLLDQNHATLPLPLGNKHQYSFGSMCGHNIVMAGLPVGQVGQSAAAAAMSAILHTFPSIQMALMVGVAGGVWSEKNDVRLGDVVISQPSKNLQHGGVIRYDYGKALHSGFQQMGMSNAPQTNVLTALSNVKSTPYGQGSFEIFLDEIEQYYDQQDSPLFERPTSPDRLFKANSLHVGETCDQCNPLDLVPRRQRNRNGPMVHYGLIASGDRVMRDAELRDRISKDNGGVVLAFDMESAALVNQCSTLVIRGIGNYCDSHKNRTWHPYASAVAAAWAKDFLRNVSPPIPFTQRFISAQKDNTEQSPEPQLVELSLTGEIPRDLTRRLTGLDHDFGGIATHLQTSNARLERD